MENKNILMISVDDLNDFVTFEQNYSGKIHAPNLQALMERGTTFTNAFCQTALCNPSRTSILTGKTPDSTGVFDNDVDWFNMVNPSETLPAVLRSSGFYNVNSGKIFHLAAAMPEYIQDELFDKYFAPKRHLSEKTENKFHYEPFQGNVEDLRDVQIANYAVDFFTNYQSDQTKPFFLAVGFHEPHLDWVVPQEFFDLYPLSEIQLPEVIEDDLSDIPKFMLGRINDKHDEVLAAGVWKEMVQAYLASISFVDAMIGRVIDSLDENGLSESTGIVLWSDHGFQLGEKERWGKFTLWDEATRAPLIVVDPEVAVPDGGQKVDQVVELLDIFPTILELAGVAPATQAEGDSLVPLLNDPQAYWENVAITQMDDSYSVRTDEYRYIRYRDGSDELYDILDDPHQWANLANDPWHMDEKAQMIAKLQEYAAAHSISVDFHVPPDGDATATIPGTDGRDKLTGTSEDDVIEGQAGDDELQGRSGDDLIRGGAGDDLIWGDYEDNNKVSGGNDSLLGGPGDDSILGQKGNDTISGGDGNDTLKGFNDEDQLSGGAGDDSLDGGGGEDRAVFYGVFADYEVAPYGNYGATVHYIGTGGLAEGTDTVTNVEWFVFRDLTVSLEELRSGGPITLPPPANREPDAVNDTAAGAENQPVTIAVLANDEDPDGDPVTVSAFTEPVSGEAVLNADGSVTYTPTDGFHGTDGFTYSITDGRGGFDSATVTVTVVRNNDPPVAIDDTVETDEDHAVTIAVLANDQNPDGDALSISMVTQGGSGQVSVNGGAVTYTPDADFNGEDVFTYTVVDGRGGTDTATVTVNVLPVNDPPVAVDDAVTTIEGDAVTVSPLANDGDVDGDALALLSVEGADGGSVAIHADDSVTFTPFADFQGIDMLSYTVVDPQGATATAAIRVEVAATCGTGSIVGTPEDDTLTGTSADDTIQGCLGADVLTGKGGADEIYGGPDDDVLRGNWGYDTLDGGAGDDTLYGGEEDDELRGGAGNDVLYGRSGADRFVFSGDFGADVIRDFSPGQGDIIRFSGYGEALDEFAELTALLSVAGGDTIADLTGLGGGTLYIEDFASVEESDVELIA